jgi:hypothetical protein
MTEIFVNLIDEPVAVRRPVQAVHLRDDVYEIADQTYDRGSEKWEFEPGDLVVCEFVDSDDGAVLTAVSRA